MTEAQPHLEIPLVLHLRPAADMTPDEFFEFCQLNRELRIERSAEGHLLIMSPTGGETSRRNVKLIAQLETWAEKNRSGVVFDSSGGFTLPDGAVRSPEAAWVRRARLAALTPEEKQKFLPLCPDFVAELRSPTDPLAMLQEKMRAYLANGAQLGWLIDPIERRVYVYRQNAAVECLDNPASVAGDPVLPGFEFDLAPIWEPGF